MVAGSPVSIQSPARSRPRTAVSVDGPRRLAGRERKRRARLADDGRAHETRAAHDRQCLEQLVVRRAQSARRCVSRDDGVAPLDTSDRCDASLAEDRALVEHPLHRAARAGRRTARRHDGAIEPQIHGHDRRRRHAIARAEHDRRERRRYGVEQLAQRKPRHGRDDDVRRPRLAALPTDADRRRRRSTRTRAGAPVRTAAAVASMNARAGSAYIRCSGCVGSAIAAARGSAPNISASTRANGGAAACRGGWLSAASASGSHSISRSRAVWPLRISQFSTVSPGDAAFAVAPAAARARAILSGARHPEHRQAIAPRQRVPVEHAGQQVQRRRQRRTRRAAICRPPRSIIVTASCGCEAHVAVGADRRAGTRTSRCSSRAARAGRCRRARRSRDRGTRSRGRRAARAPRARARARRAASSRTAALKPAKPAPMTTTS